MITVTVWVKSDHAGSAVVEMIGSPDQAFDDGPTLVGAPEVNGLSDSNMGEFILDLQGFDEVEIRDVAASLGLAGLCILNKYNIDTAEDEEPRDAEMPFWQDAIRIKPVGEVAAAIRLCIRLLQARDPELMQLISGLRKGTGESDEMIRDELIHEFELLEQHLEWIGRHRSSAVVSMFANL
jgi:hypothetical protein